MSEVVQDEKHHKWPPQPPMLAQRARFIHLMRRHVHAEDYARTDDDLARTVYKRFYVNPELHLKTDQPFNHGTSKTFEQRERYREIMRRHIRGQDASLTDRAFVDQVYRRYAYERQVPLIDPNE